MFCQHKKVCLFAWFRMLNESLLTITPHSCGPAIPPFHYVSRSMAKFLAHLQEGERGRVTADGFQLCHRTGHPPALWRREPAWLSQGWPTRGHAAQQARKLSSRARERTSPIAETPHLGYAPQGVTPQERGWNRGLPAILVKRLHYPSWMQEQAMLVYPVDDTPGFLFL